MFVGTYWGPVDEVITTTGGLTFTQITAVIEDSDLVGAFDKSEISAAFDDVVATVGVEQNELIGSVNISGGHLSAYLQD